MSGLNLLDGQEVSVFRKAYHSGTSADPYTFPSSDGISIAVAPTITAGAYSAGDAVGEMMTFPDAVLGAGEKGKIKSVVLVDKNDDVLADLEVWLFDSDPSSVADNAQFDISDANMLKCVGIIKIAAADYSAALDNSVAVVPDPGIQFHCVAKDLFAQIIAPYGGSPPTYSSTSDLSLMLEIEYKS